MARVHVKEIVDYIYIWYSNEFFLLRKLEEKSQIIISWSF